MRYYFSQNTDPRFNLALEEYLFDNVKEDLFMLWQNDKSVIIGKNQNAYAEVDFDFAKENDIKIVRRITGGGAVFHDLGNINYTFVSVCADEKMDFKYFSAPIAQTLRELGVEVGFSGRNDLVLSDGRKISGTARCERNGRIMHHGTLLFSADMSYLASALRVNKTKMLSKGVKSVKSAVGNIYNELPSKLTPSQFIEKVAKSISEKYSCKELEFSKEDEEKVIELMNSKYATDHWNLSTNLPFENECEKYFPYGLVQVKFRIKNGCFEKVKFYGDFFGKGEIGELEERLEGVFYEKENLKKLLEKENVGEYISGAVSDEIAELFFI